MQIIPGITLVKSQAAIISLSTLYFESIVKMRNPMDLSLLTSISSSTSKTSDMSESSTKSCSKLKTLPLDDLPGAVSAYVQTTFITFVLRRGMTRLECHLLSLILKIWKSLIQRLGLGNWVNCRDNKHYEQVKTTCLMF